jgi:DNA-binding SARP family transcriptional activator
MNELRISLFGQFEARCGKKIFPSINSQKALELFCYLILYRERPHPREKLAELLWGEEYSARSKKYLRKTLWQLQSTLKSYEEIFGNQVLLVTHDFIQLNHDAKYWLDIAIFEHAFSICQGIPGREIASKDIQTIKSAVDLYQADLLEGWYQDWCIFERERFKEMLLAMTHKLMDYFEMNREYEAGVSYGNRVFEYDPAYERAHRRMMRLHYLSGDRFSALKQFERCKRSLKEELCVEPSQQTVELYNQIVQEKFVDKSIKSMDSITAETLPPKDICDCLIRIKTIMTNNSSNQEKLLLEISTLEEKLKHV